jgi:hypothetical protein
MAVESSPEELKIDEVFNPDSFSMTSTIKGWAKP